MKCTEVTATPCTFGELKVGDCFLSLVKRNPMIKLPQVYQEGNGNANAFALRDNYLWYFPDSLLVIPIPNAELHY